MSPDCLQIKYIAKPVLYDGTQLSPHWIYRQWDLLGSALVAFVGESRVSIDHMVDLEDVKANAPIYSPLMLHFIAEWFTDSFELGIAYQHLFIHLVAESLRHRGVTLVRRGDDIYVNERKLSVSIATRSLGSALMHTGLNIRTENTPVPTAGLEELGISAESLGRELLERFQEEYSIWRKARHKVLPR